MSYFVRDSPGVIVLGSSQRIDDGRVLGDWEVWVCFIPGQGDELKQQPRETKRGWFLQLPSPEREDERVPENWRIGDLCDDFLQVSTSTDILQLGGLEEVGQDFGARPINEGRGGIHSHHGLDGLDAAFGVIEFVDAISSILLHTQALDEERGRVWREGLSTVDDIVEVPLESYCTRVHLDTDIRGRSARVAGVGVVVGIGQGRLKSVAGSGWGAPCDCREGLT